MQRIKDNIKIFYADDDPDDAYFFESAIKEGGWKCEVKTFSNGIDLIEDLDIDAAFHNIIFLDINMPLKNGLDCLKEIKEHKDWKAVPVFMISTSNNTGMKERAMDLGARGYIEKPSEFNLLKEKLNEALKQSLA